MAAAARRPVPVASITHATARSRGGSVREALRRCRGARRRRAARRCRRDEHGRGHPTPARWVAASRVRWAHTLTNREPTTRPRGSSECGPCSSYLHEETFCDWMHLQEHDALPKGQ